MNVSSSTGKMPVSILQELLSHRGITPAYELLQTEGPPHMPTFHYRVTARDSVAMGMGRSEKEAKHASANAILEMWNKSSEDGSATLREEIVPPFDNKIPKNPIGLLQEICMARHWLPPCYTVISEEGLPHDKLFTMACVVLKDTVTGTGKSKQLAKQQVAHKMWEKLRDCPLAPSGGACGLKDVDDGKVDTYMQRIQELELMQKHQSQLILDMMLQRATCCCLSNIGMDQQDTAAGSLKGLLNRSWKSEGSLMLCHTTTSAVLEVLSPLPNSTYVDDMLATSSTGAVVEQLSQAAMQPTTTMSHFAISGEEPSLPTAELILN